MLGKTKKEQRPRGGGIFTNQQAWTTKNSLQHHFVCVKGLLFLHGIFTQQKKEITIEPRAKSAVG